MEYRPRIYYTDAQKALMWDRWQKGESLNAIARLFGRHHPSIRGVLAQSGAQGGRELGIAEQVAGRAGAAGGIEEVAARGRGETIGAVPAQQQVQARRDPEAIARQPDGGREQPRPGQAAVAAVDGELTGRSRPTRPPGIGRAAPRPVD